MGLADPDYLQLPGSALEGLLMDLTKVAKKASDELGSGVDVDALANHAVKVNVFHTVDFLLQYSALVYAARPRIEPRQRLAQDGGVW